MKLEVGMYVRTKNNPYMPSEIAQIIKMDDKYIYLDIDKDSNVVWEYPEYIEKASFDVIDVLECGDYVNGYKVSRISGTIYDKNDSHCYCDYCQNKETLKWIMIAEKDIKSIVTKEQFEQMSYKLGE